MMDKDNKLQAIISTMISELGEDINREGIVKTPERVEKSMRFLTNGYHKDFTQIINNAVFQAECSEMVIVKEIEFYSLCEHHMLPFFGKAHIAYIPKEKILGLSKFARVTDFFARRMQVQERMTRQIADSLMELLEPKGLAVITDAQHLCMMMRGVEKQGSSTRVQAMRGVFKTNPSTRTEFLASI